VREVCERERTLIHLMQCFPQNVLMLITEGQSNMNRGLSPSEAATARRAGITVLGVGVGPETDGIRNIVRDEGKLLLVSDYVALPEVASEVASLLCQGNTSTSTLVHSNSPTFTHIVHPHCILPSKFTELSSV